MSDELNRRQLVELKEVFKRFDKDQNGYIDLDEFQEVLHALGEDPPDPVVEFNFSVIDQNEDGVVNFQEFSKWWLDR